MFDEYFNMAKRNIELSQAIIFTKKEKIQTNTNGLETIYARCIKNEEKDAKKE